MEENKELLKKPETAEAQKPAAPAAKPDQSGRFFLHTITVFHNTPKIYLVN